jgi:ribosome-associated protein
MESTLPPAEALLERLNSRIDDRPPSGVSSEEQIRLAVAAALDRKAEDLQVLDLARISDVTDYFVLCSASNERQVQAIAEGIQDVLRRAQVRPLSVEGRTHARWILLDYGGDMVIHVFHRQERSFYDLDRLWSDAPNLTEKVIGSVPASETTRDVPGDTESSTPPA